MIYSLLADAVVLLHVGFVLFVVCGGMLALYHRRVAWLHVPALLWGVVVELAGWVCPLTPMENWLRVQAGHTGYGGDFIGRYLTAALYPEGLTRPVQVALGLIALSLNVAVYSIVVRRSAPGRR